MRRGEIWTAAGGGDYSDKPRPVIVLQSDQFDATDSITVCGLTTDPQPMSLFRVPIEPNRRNHLDQRCHAMLDKIITLRRTRLGYMIGEVELPDMAAIDRAIVSFLGVSPPAAD